MDQMDRPHLASRMREEAAACRQHLLETVVTRSPEGRREENGPDGQTSLALPRMREEAAACRQHLLKTTATCGPQGRRGENEKAAEEKQETQEALSKCKPGRQRLQINAADSTATAFSV